MLAANLDGTTSEHKEVIVSNFIKEPVTARLVVHGISEMTLEKRNELIDWLKEQVKTVKNSYKHKFGKKFRATLYK